MALPGQGPRGPGAEAKRSGEVRVQRGRLEDLAVHRGISGPLNFGKDTS